MSYLLCLCVILVVATCSPLPSPNQRAKALLANMTLTEKLHMVHGDPSVVQLYAGRIPGNDRLKIPTLNLQDGPQGVGDDAKEVTCWPSALTVAATWDVDLMYEFAAGTASEERGKGANIMLSPMVNIVRVPMAGRNYETFGEDPTLSSKLVVASINGIQSQGVIATVKHWVDYNQEYERTKVSANVDERTNWEIYYPAFQAAVDAGVGAVMCSYNRINNTYACENEQTITTDLKGRMNFQGFLMSDWFATHSTADSALNGLDMEMPIPLYFGVPLTVDVDLGKVPVSRIDDMVTRILTAMFAAGIFDTPQTGSLSDNVTSEAHTLLARKLAASGTVLLKNDGNLLPLDASNLKSISVIGDDASDVPIFHGTGSGKVNWPYVVTPLEGIQARAGSGVSVSYTNSKSIPNAIKAAQAATVAVVFVAVESGEGTDRPNLSLPGNQDQLVAAVAKAQPNTVVVIHGSGAVLMDWVDSVPSIAYAFFPGQEDGNAIASVLFGDVNPSARLPMTFPKTESEIPVNSTIQYPGVNEQTDYTEKLLVGYRWYDAQNVEPLFPFGHGLSYTTFSYSNLVISNISSSEFQVKATIKNTGNVLGAEVAQLYLGFPANAGEPPKVLRDFQKVELSPNSTAILSFVIQQQQYSIWDIVSHSWQVAHGQFFVYVGASSRDIRLISSFVV